MIVRLAYLSPIALLCAATMLVQTPALAIEGRVRLSFDGGQPLWVGQKVELNLDLMTTGFSFSDQHFQLPEPGGALLLQTDSSTIKATEQIDGVTWQILRYPVLLYAQRAGEISVPAFEVTFSAAEGYGSEPEAFRFSTGPLSLEARLPPGVDSADGLVVTTDFTLEVDWQPALAQGTAKVGDAFTRIVTRRARDISGMVFSPLPLPRIEGLAVYPREPVVQDRSNRGELTGERVESVTFVCEQPGRYTLPAHVVSWWDPQKQQLIERPIPEVVLEVAANPALPSADEAELSQRTSVSVTQWQLSGWWIAAALLVLAVAAVLIRRFYQPLAARWRMWMRRAESERTLFNRVVMSCWGDDPVAVYNALMRWLDDYRDGSAPVTLSALLTRHPDAVLERELTLLQQAMLTARSDWSGRALIVALSRWREAVTDDGAKRRNSELAPLNP
jgi:hypothetical protein